MCQSHVMNSAEGTRRASLVMNHCGTYCTPIETYCMHVRRDQPIILLFWCLGCPCRREATPMSTWHRTLVQCAIRAPRFPGEVMLFVDRLLVWGHWPNFFHNFLDYSISWSWKYQLNRQCNHRCPDCTGVWSVVSLLIRTGTYRHLPLNQWKK